jgi:hypothetical protein
MRTAHSNLVDRAQLAAMCAMLCTYEELFGPYHFQSLSLMVDFALWQHRERRIWGDSTRLLNSGFLQTIR